MEVLHLNPDSFKKLTTQSERPVLIDFWASWCGPCRMLAAELEALAAEHPELTIGKLNVDEPGNGEIAAGLGVDAIPALFYFRSGKLEKKLVGFMSKDELAARLEL